MSYVIPAAPTPSVAVAGSMGCFLIYSGTPAGVGPIKPGDIMHGGVDKVGEMTVRVL